jgi:hypothetical protein
MRPCLRCCLLSWVHEIVLWMLLMHLFICTVFMFLLAAFVVVTVQMKSE